MAKGGIDVSRRESPLEVTIKGAAAGLAGTAVLTVAMSLAPKLMQQLGMSEGQSQGGQRPKQQATNEQANEEPTEKLAGKIAEGVFEKPLDEDAKQVAGQPIRWSYGAGWGAVYGIAQSSLRLPHFLHGSIFGTLVGVVASTLVPAMGLTPPPTSQPMPKNAMQFGMHLLYGWVTALAFHVLSSDE